MLNDVQKHILQVVADMADGNAPGAVNIRSDGQKAYRHNTENIEIISKTDQALYQARGRAHPGRPDKVRLP